MELISDIKFYDKKIDLQTLKNNCSNAENPYKVNILKYLKDSKNRSSCTTDKVYDYFSNRFVNIPIVAYHDDSFYWDDRDIYYFEKYNLKLTEEFVNHVLEQTERSKP